MRITLKHAVIGGFGLAVVGACLAAVAVMSPPVRPDTGGGLAPMGLNAVPKLRSDPMHPTGTDEADRRATKNARDTAAAERAGKSFVAGPLITTTQGSEAGAAPPSKPSLPEVVQPDPQQISFPSNAPPGGGQQTSTGRTDAERKRDTEFDDKVKAQLEALMKPSNGAQWVTVAFKAPSSPPKAEARPAVRTARDGSTAAQPPPYVDVLAAKPGDIFYSRISVGFNSDDPSGLAVFTTIHDERPDGTYGPLHGARLMGSVVYAPDQAAVPMQRLILADGREAATKAMAVTLDEVRSGVAEKVDYHTLSRWSGLLASGLIQGAGQAGQLLLSNNRSVFLSPGGYSSVGRPGIDWGQVGLATLAPLGQNLSSVAAQNFNRPATKSARGGPNGTEVGVVFLESVTIPTLLPAAAQGGVPGTAPGRERP